MKRVTTLLLSAFIVACLASVTWAGIQGTAHEVGLASPAGVCSNCHIPHKALGDRLWPSAPDATIAGAWGTVGSLCYDCHGTGGLSNALAVNTVFGTNAHPVTDADAVTSTDASGSGLNYAGASFECSTCHNPHADKYSTSNPTFPAFLAVAPGQLCASCHQLRQYVGGAASTAVGAWGAFYGSANPGAHPVGTDVTTDNSDAGNSPINIATNFEIAYDGGSQGSHNLGGHPLQDAAGGIAAQGMGCVTCHAVHGLNTAADGEGGSSAAVESLLVPTYAQGSLSGVASGQGDQFNVLCENCHGATTNIALGGASDPNPGGTAFTHPVDQMAASDMGTVTVPGGWPVGSTAGTNMDAALICETCHLPHPNADAVTEGEHITRAQGVCLQCHGGAGYPNHHPIAATMPSGYADAPIAGNDGTATDLTCYDCHGGANGAHNWTAAATAGGIGLNPAWEPTGNLRTGDAVGANASNMSKECVDCHMGGDPKANPSPGPDTDSNADYQDGGPGHHWIGTNGGYGAGVTYAGGVDPATVWARPSGTFDATGTAWPAGGWSRFGAAVGDTVCESCHELEPDKNTGNDLLLYAYAEGADIERNPLCEGCHGAAPVSGGTHPMTGDTVTRTGAALDTNTSSYATATPGGNATYPATADRMNCDSCHQPHEAQTGGLILEDGTGTPAYSGGAFSGFDFRPLCSDCHTGYY